MTSNPGFGDLSALVADQLLALDSMFDDPGLGNLRSATPSHPAVVRYDLLKQLHGAALRIRWPFEYDPLHAFAMQSLDTVGWTPRSVPAEGIWAVLGDTRTERHVAAAIRDPDQFGDTMAELYLWGWLRSQGFDALRKEDEGLSDIAIQVPCGQIRAEVKRIRYDSNPARIGEIIRNANRQIKRSDPDRAGLLYISITRPNLPLSYDDSVPSDVARYVDEVRDALHPGQLRSVAQVVVGWDDFLLRGDFPDPVMYGFRRRSVRIDHPTPRSPGLLGDQHILGHTVVAVLRRKDNAPLPQRAPNFAPVDGRDARVSAMFREQSEYADGVRPAHALAALRDPTALENIRVDEVRLLLATKEVKGPSPLTLLVIATQLESRRVEIVNGYKFHRAPDDGTNLARDPLNAFRVLLERYGLAVRVGPSTGLFLPDTTIAGMGAVELATPSPESGFAMMAIMERRTNGTCRVRCVFAIDRGRYQAALRKRAS